MAANAKRAIEMLQDGVVGSYVRPSLIDRITQLLNIEEDAKCLLDTFKTAETQGYENRDRRFAITLLERNIKSLPNLSAGCKCSCHRYVGCIACLDCGENHPGSKCYEHFLAKRRNINCSVESHD